MSLDITELRGKTITKIVGGKQYDDEIVFHTTCGRKFKMLHLQDCCESVFVEDVSGDLNDLIGTPILLAEEVTNSDDPPNRDGYTPESFTWTFYKLATIKGAVTIRWFGESNGWYSEGVEFVEAD